MSGNLELLDVNSIAGTVWLGRHRARLLRCVSEQHLFSPEPAEGVALT
jgi:hypothetical protein